MTNINGTAITYDNLGNPLKWHNASAITWNGRRMKTFTKTDGTVISYTYDGNGIRTGKTVGSSNVQYILDGTKIVREIRNDYVLTFLYDDSDSLIGFNYNAGTDNDNYYYGIDNFGNINYIYDASGNIVVTYRYDAWGKPISTTGTAASTIGAANPYRYKSYYYDTETGLYYLQSRYYDAGVGRFVNADEPILLGISGGIYSHNLYAYCENDPVNHIDTFGESPLQVLLAAIFGIVGFIIGDYIALNLGLAPSGKGWWNATRYWAVRAAVGVGGAALGWFAGALIAKATSKYLSSNPQIMLKLAARMGSKFLIKGLQFIGINPIGFMNKSLLMGFLQNVFNVPDVIMPVSWVKILLEVADNFGFTIRLDSGHIGTAWNFIHLHIGKVHIAIEQSVIPFIKKFLGL